MVKCFKMSPQLIGRYKNMRPKCKRCDRDLYEYIVNNPKAKIWGLGSRKGGHRKKQRYCDDCHGELFEGVKLHSQVHHHEILCHDRETEAMIVQACEVLKK